MKKLIDNNIYKDLSKVCLDVAKYVLTGAILAPFFKDFENSTKMYLVAAGLFLFVLFLYWIFNFLSKEGGNTR
jgi:apolipoprotein N-acyltransferase